MSKTNRKAGQNIRQLALRRRAKAINFFLSAGVVISIPFLLNYIYGTFTKQFNSANPSGTRVSFNYLPISYILLILIALGLITNGVFWWKRANHADQGAGGEESIAREIVRLEQEGWQFEYGTRLGNRLGDADIICISPQNKAYVIDVKSHRGEVTTDGKILYRCVGGNTYPFEKNFLSQAMKQALQVKKQKKLGFVTPIVTFSDATVPFSDVKVQSVYVTDRSSLVTLLRSLG
jgi:hypothetical protein